MCRIFFDPTAKKSKILEDPRGLMLKTLVETGKLWADI
jgi:hypothetical protein